MTDSSTPNPQGEAEALSKQSGTGRTRPAEKATAEAVPKQPAEPDGR